MTTTTPADGTSGPRCTGTPTSAQGIDNYATLQGWTREEYGRKAYYHRDGYTVMVQADGEGRVLRATLSKPGAVWVMLRPEDTDKFDTVMGWLAPPDAQTRRVSGGVRRALEQVIANGRTDVAGMQRALVRDAESRDEEELLAAVLAIARLRARLAVHETALSLAVADDLGALEALADAHGEQAMDTPYATLEQARRFGAAQASRALGTILEGFTRP